VPTPPTDPYALTPQVNSRAQWLMDIELLCLRFIGCFSDRPAAGSVVLLFADLNSKSVMLWIFPGRLKSKSHSGEMVLSGIV